jgi:protein TonB
MTTIMKNLHKIDENVASTDQIRESSKKRDVNLQSNSSLYFQIGLILCLLATYGLFEMKFQKSIMNFGTEKLEDENSVFYIPNINVVPDVVQPKEQPKRQLAVLITKPPVIKPDDYVIPKPVDIVTPESSITVVEPKSNPTKVDLPVDAPTNKPFNMKDVEKVPIFPGCESAKNNAERMECMSEKLTKLIQRKFNTDLAHDLGLSGIQKIQVQFKIDDKGHVTDIKTRSPYSQLEKEAERVVSKIPVMTPGMQRNTPVSVVYYLPIAFQVH